MEEKLPSKKIMIDIGFFSRIWSVVTAFIAGVVRTRDQRVSMVNEHWIECYFTQNRGAKGEREIRKAYEQALRIIIHIAIDKTFFDLQVEDIKYCHSLYMRGYQLRTQVIYVFFRDNEERLNDLKDIIEIYGQAQELLEICNKFLREGEKFLDQQDFYQARIYFNRGWGERKRVAHRVVDIMKKLGSRHRKLDPNSDGDAYKASIFNSPKFYLDQVPGLLADKLQDGINFLEEKIRKLASSESAIDCQNRITYRQELKSFEDLLKKKKE